MTLPGTRSRPAHVPPVDQSEVPDPGGSTPYERLFRLQKAVGERYQQYRASIPDGVSPDDLREAAGVFVASNANSQLGPALAAVRDDATEAAKHVTDLIKGVKVGGDTASLLAAQAYWQRKSKVLDSITDKARSDGVAVAAPLRWPDHPLTSGR